MPFDQHKNLAIAVVAVAPSPPDTGLTLTVAAGHGARYPVPPFDVTIWLATKYPNPDDAEVAKCTAIAGDQLTILRAQGGTTARLVQPGDLIAESITAQYLQSLETAIGTTPSPPTLHAPTHAEGGTDPVQLTQSQITGLTTSLTTIEGDITTLEGNVTTLQTIVTSGPVAAHHVTHETGGADALAALSASILTSGSLPFARVPISAASRLLGRGSAGGAGAMQELTLGTGLTMTGTVLSSSGGGAPAAHAPTHAAAGSDPVTVTALAGYPGGTANFLRADGTFAVPPGGGAGADEVFVGATDPGATYELWYDTAAVSPTTNYALLNAANTFTQTQMFGGDVVLTTNGAVRRNTPDGADNSYLQLNGGGGAGPTRGGTVDLFGNEFVGAPGVLRLWSGDVPGGQIECWTGGLERGRMYRSGGFSWGSTVDPGAGSVSASGGIRATGALAGGAGPAVELAVFGTDAYVNAYDRTAGAYVPLWIGGTSTNFHVGGTTKGKIHNSGGFSWGSTTDPGANNFSVADMVFAKATATDVMIRRTTPDGADNGRLDIAGGGGLQDSRGAVLSLLGNEAGGGIYLIAGNTPGAGIGFYTGASQPRGTIHPSGGFSWGGTTDPGAATMSVGYPNGWIFYPSGNATSQSAGTGVMVHLGFYNANGQVGSISSSGTVTTYNTASDARLKTPLTRHTDTEVLRNTIIHNFLWKADGQPGRGVFAQEAAVVAPFAVSVGTDAVDDEGRLTHPWGVDYSKYVPDLITGWQAHDTALLELIADNVALAARMESLERLAATLVVPSYAKPLSLFQRVREAIAAWFPAWITPRKERRCLT